jgi:hypothetical protein
LFLIITGGIATSINIAEIKNIMCIASLLFVILSFLHESSHILERTITWSSSDFGSYGNSGISSGVGGREGVIDLGDEGGVIGFGDEGGVIGFGDEGGVIGDVVVSFLIDFGRPQTSDSVELTNSSFGLLGSHICAFISGDTIRDGGAEVGGGGGGGEVGNGNTGPKGDCSSPWAWVTIKPPVSITELIAVT